MNAFLSMIVAGLNFFPGLKTKVAAVSSATVAFLVVLDVAMKQFDMSFTIPHLTEINALLIALTAVGAANQPGNGK